MLIKINKLYYIYKVLFSLKYLILDLFEGEVLCYIIFKDNKSESGDFVLFIYGHTVRNQDIILDLNCDI